MLVPFSILIIFSSLIDILNKNENNNKNNEKMEKINNFFLIR